MHYLGMSALHASAHMHHAPLFVAASVAVAVAASGLALWLAAGRGGRPPLILSASPSASRSRACTTPRWQGVTLFPHAARRRRRAGAVDRPAGDRRRGRRVLRLRHLPAVPGAGRRRPRGAVPSDCRDRSPRRCSAPAGSRPRLRRISAAARSRRSAAAGGPPRRFARHCRSSATARTHFVAVDDIVAVHANAHYTYLFDGDDEAVLPARDRRRGVAARPRPLRPRPPQPHHQYRPGRRPESAPATTGWSRWTAREHYAVPVSRSRVGWLKSRVAAIRMPRQQNRRRAALSRRNAIACASADGRMREPTIASVLLTQFVQNRAAFVHAPLPRAPAAVAAAHTRQTSILETTGNGANASAAMTGHGAPGRMP